ncbi:hypothetical protein ACOMCU_00370 [Lysinibacillus sp. UGB7]|uniref:hypothetical protein n=1 Tax=Lysinibacillus sp. UGB7 TaxID=3411039 RepID=UPI003B78FDBF
MVNTIQMPANKKKLEVGNRVKTNLKLDGVEATGTVKALEEGGLFALIDWDKDTFENYEGHQIKVGELRIAEHLIHLEEEVKS